MLNTRNEEKNTAFYLYLACFRNTSILYYARIHVIYRVNQAEYAIHLLVVAPQEYVNIYSTRRVRTCPDHECAEVFVEYELYLYLDTYISAFV